MIPKRLSEEDYRRLGKDIKQLLLERGNLMETASKLEAERSDVIAGLSKGLKTDSDLLSVGKHLDQARSDFLANTEVLNVALCVKMRSIFPLGFVAQMKRNKEDLDKLRGELGIS